MRACLVALLSAVVVSATAGASSPRTGDLLYLRALGGNEPPWGRLFVARADGSGARDVTPAGITDVQGAAWSPDGNRIAISAIAAGDGDPEISTLAPAGSDLRPLTRNHLSDRSGASPRQLTATSGVTEWGPDWQRR